jgi:ubiquinone biosynthesis protein
VFVRALAEGLPPLDFDTIIRGDPQAWSAPSSTTRAKPRSPQAWRRSLAGHPQIGVPEVVRERSSARVLCTTFMAGEKITSVLDRLAEQRAAGDSEAGQQLSAVLAALLEAYARQTLEAGVFQADPHPGNLLVQLEGDACALTVLDFGCAKQLDPDERRALLALLGAVLMRDAASLASALEALGFQTKSGTRAGLEALAQGALSRLSLVKSDGGGFHGQLDVISRIAEFGRQLEADPIVKLPESFVMLGRVFGTLSGLFVHYRPDLDVTARVLPVVMAALAGSARGARGFEAGLGLAANSTRGARALAKSVPQRCAQAWTRPSNAVQ